jgi:hypothetical protein
VCRLKENASVWRKEKPDFSQKSFFFVASFLAACSSSCGGKNEPKMPILAIFGLMSG